MSSTFKISGDTAKLTALINRLKGAEQKIGIRAAQVSTPVVKKLVHRHFIETKSPDETTWSALKKPTGLPPIRGLMDYFIYQTFGKRIHVTNSKWYTKFHQTGTRFMDARRFLPWDYIPTKWRKSLEPTIKREVKKILGLIN